MSNCSGEDLLKVFSELNISLSNLDPNIIKAWFDTDDEDLKNLLNWMCTSLSKENYLSPLEYAEFLEIKTPLVGDKYEQEVKKINEKYPGILDANQLALEVELLEDEVELLLEEEKHLDELIKINENVQKELTKELDVNSKEQIRTALILKSTEKLCASLGEKLDETNGKIHEQLVKYGSNLYDFEYGCVSNFINNMDITQFWENFDNITSFLMPLLDLEFTVDDANITVTNEANNSMTNTLDTMKNRLLQSRRNYVIAKIEMETAKETLDYLNKTDVSSLLLLSENPYTQMRREEKEERKHGLCGMMDETLQTWAEEQVAHTRLKYARRDLEMYQAKSERLKLIEDSMLKQLSQYLLLSMLYDQEKKDIDDSDQFFRKILQYISKDLQSVTTRTEKMRKIISEQEEYKSKNIGEKFGTIKSIVRILTNEQDFDWNKSLEVVGEFKNELDRLQIKAFHSDFYDHKQAAKELCRNVDVLQSFLVCGPTCRIITIPPELRAILAVVEDNLKKQEASVKNAVKVYLSTKITDKWQKYRHLLWTYFYTNPKRLFQVLREVEEESKKQKKPGGIQNEPK